MAAKAGSHFQNVMQGLPTSPGGYTDALEQHYASGNQTAQAAFERYVQPGSVADGLSPARRILTAASKRSK